MSEETENKALVPVTEDGDSLPDMKFLQYWWNLVCGEESKDYEYVDGKVEHLEGNKCRIRFKTVNRKDGTEKAHFINVGKSGFVSLGSITEGEEGEVVEDKTSFKNILGSLAFNLIFFVNKMTGKI